MLSDVIQWSTIVARRGSSIVPQGSVSRPITAATRILAHRTLQHEPLHHPVFRHIRKARRRRVLHRADTPFDALHNDAAAIGRANAEERERQFRTAGADQAGDAKDLALIKVEGNIGEVVLLGKVTHFKQLLARPAGVAEPRLRQRSLSHHLDQPFVAQLLARQRAHRAAVAQYRR